jgi:hypothetical protein
MTENSVFSHYPFPGIFKLYGVIYEKDETHYFLPCSRKLASVENDEIRKCIPARGEVAEGVYTPPGHLFHEIYYTLLPTACVLLLVYSRRSELIRQKRSSDGGEHEDGRLLACSAVWTGRSLLVLQRSLLPSSP